MDQAYSNMVYFPLGARGITLTEDQFDELQTIRQNISEMVSHKIETQDTNGTNGDSDSDKELTEQICRINITAHTRGAADKLEHLPSSMTFFKD